MHRLARALTRDAASAEDVLQETFLAAWRGASGYRGDASERAWLLTIARHAAQRHGEREARHRPDEPELFELGRLAGWGVEDPEAVAMRAQDRGRLERALRALAPADREVIALRDLDGLSGEEAAAILGLDLAATKSRLHRARLRLAAALRDGGCDGRS